MFMALSERYCKLSSHKNIIDLAREIAIAKAWIVTEVITLLQKRKKAAFPIYLNWYREHLPDWLDNVKKNVMKNEFKKCTLPECPLLALSRPPENDT